MLVKLILVVLIATPLVYCLTCHCTVDPDEASANADKDMMIEDQIATDEAEAMLLVEQMKCKNKLCQMKETVWTQDRITQATCVISESPEGEVVQICQYNPQYPQITAEYCPVTPSPSNSIKYCVADRCNTNVNCTNTEQS